MMKKSGIFLRSNSINFDPPLNCYVPSAWLPMADGFPGHLDFAGKEPLKSFSQVKALMANFSYDFAHIDQLLFSFCGLFLVLSMVGSRVVQDCSNGSTRAAGIALHASLNCKNTRDAWARYVRTKRKNFHPLPNTLFIICSVHFKESCFTRAFDPSQRRQRKPGSLPTIWKKEEQTKDVESERSLCMMEKKRRKVRLW